MKVQEAIWIQLHVEIRPVSTKMQTTRKSATKRISPTIYPLLKMGNMLPSPLILLLLSAGSKDPIVLLKAPLRNAKI